MNKGRQSANTCLKYNNNYPKKIVKRKNNTSQYMWKKKCVSLFLYIKKVYNNERENKVTK